MGIQIALLSEEGKKYLSRGHFGLEKETLRVDARGFLAQTPHPFSDDPHRERDFCENQLEMITGVNESVADAWSELAKLHRDTVAQLQTQETGPEYLWPFSNPPYVRGEDDIPIAKYTGELASKTVYREYLAEKYGKKKMLFSGIHFNFSFPEQLLREDFENSGKNSFLEYKNRLYLDLAGKVLKYSWLIVFLTAASPVLDGSLCEVSKIGVDVRSRYASPRCSEVGYWNHFLPVLDFDSLDGYVESIQKYVDDGQLRQTSELYYPVRLKPSGENLLENLKQTGVNHIELRMFDLNPLAEIGIDRRDLEFVFYLLLYLALLPEEPMTVSDQIVAIRNEKNAALFDENEIQIEQEWLRSVLVTDAAAEVLDRMEELLASYLDADQVHAIIAYQREKVEQPSKRYARRVSELYGKNYVKSGLRLAKGENYVFWGWQRATVPAISGEYPGIETPQDLYDALSELWCADTCAPRMRHNWTTKNRTLGQCSITGFLVQDIFGGEVHGVLRPAGNYHCFNVVDGHAFDLTSEQFGDEVLDYENCPVQSREVHFAKEEKRQRYEYLKAALKKYCEDRITI